MGCCILMFLLSAFLVNTIHIEHREREQMAATWESVVAGDFLYSGPAGCVGWPHRSTCLRCCWVEQPPCCRSMRGIFCTLVPGGLGC